MLANLSAATSSGGGFPVTQLITLVIIGAVLYPVQKRLRAAARRQRHETWEREGLLEQQPDPEPDSPSDSRRDDSKHDDSPDADEHHPG